MIDIWMLFTILVLACFVGYFVVWGVTPNCSASPPDAVSKQGKQAAA